MEQVLDTVSWVMLVAGGLIAVASAYGLLRLPDVYARMHPASMLDTAGSFLVVGGLVLQSGLSIVTLKLVLLYAFLLLTTATAAHVLAKSALRFGPRPLTGARAASEEGEVG